MNPVEATSHAPKEERLFDIRVTQFDSESHTELNRVIGIVPN